MRKAEDKRHDRERRPGKCSKRHTLEIVTNKVAKKETTPEYFFDQRNHNDQPKKTQANGGPIDGRILRENIRIKPDGPGREP